MKLRYVKNGKVLIIEDEYGNQEIINKKLRDSFAKERKIPDREKNEK